MKKFAVQRIDFPLQDWTKDDENHSTSVRPEGNSIIYLFSEKRIYFDILTNYPKE